MTKARDISRYGLGVGIQSASSVIAGVGITQLNFIGAGNTFRVSGGTVDIDIDGLTNTTNINTSGIVTATGGFNIGIQSAGVNQTTGVITAINFIGSGNTFRYDASTKTIDVSISGGGGGGVSTTGILSCRAIANSALVFESLTLGDSFAQGTNYAMVGPITITGTATTVTVGAGVSYVIV